jgi:MoaA/NifB/PqqE/SkfB family radical SAM enzyme
MRFPLRLTADLTLALAARAMRTQHGHPLILSVSPDGAFHYASAVVDTRRNGHLEPKAAAAGSLRSRIIWIGGSEPLKHPEIARVATALAGAGRHVFLQADGALLKRRIHEFQPSSRLFLTFRFDGTEPSHDRRSARRGAFRAAVEGIRAARLSGFLICAHIVLHADSEPGELARFHGEICKLDVDGMLISPAALTAELQHRVTEARRSLLSRRWALLSGLLHCVALPMRVPAISRNSSEFQPAMLPKSQPSEREEGAQA